MDEDADRVVAPRAGRRARQPASQAYDNEQEQDGQTRGFSSGGADGADLPSPESAPPPAFQHQRSSGGPEPEENEDNDAPPPQAKQGFGTMSFKPPAIGGFGVDNIPRPAPDSEIDATGSTKFAGVSRRKQDQRVREDEEKERVQSKYDEKAEKAAPIDSIMEIEEEGKEDMSNMVAEAPKVRSNKVQDITELDEDMQFHLPTTDDRDVDLSLLTSVLCSSEQVYEPDEVWDEDMLFTAVASELHQEKEKAEGPTDASDGKENDQMSGL